MIKEAKIKLSLVDFPDTFNLLKIVMLWIVIRHYNISSSDFLTDFADVLAFLFLSFWSNAAARCVDIEKCRRQRPGLRFLLLLMAATCASTHVQHFMTIIWVNCQRAGSLEDHTGKLAACGVNTASHLVRPLICLAALATCCMEPRDRDRDLHLHEQLHLLEQPRLQIRSIPIRSLSWAVKGISVRVCHLRHGHANRGNRLRQ